MTLKVLTNKNKKKLPWIWVLQKRMNQLIKPRKRKAKKIVQRRCGNHIEKESPRKNRVLNTRSVTHAVPSKLTDWGRKLDAQILKKMRTISVDGEALTNLNYSSVIL